MPRCHYTSVELDRERCYVLDIRAAERAIRRLRSHVTTLKRLLTELGQPDVRTHFAHGTSKPKKVYHKRVVSPGVAEALAGAAAGESLFVPLTAWRAEQRVRDRARRRRAAQSAGPSDGEGPDEHEDGT